MAKKSNRKSKPAVTTVLQLFQPTDFINVEHLRDGDKISGTKFEKNVRTSVIHTVAKVITPARDYMYYWLRFVEVNLVVFVQTREGEILCFQPMEKIPIIRND